MECRHFGKLQIKFKKLQAKGYRNEHLLYCDQCFKNYLTNSNMNAIFVFVRKFDLRIPKAATLHIVISYLGSNVVSIHTDFAFTLPR